MSFSGATTTGLPAGVLYQVRTTYKYDREDVDELSFEVGEVINVVEYEDPEEQVRLNPLRTEFFFFVVFRDIT